MPFSFLELTRSGASGSLHALGLATEIICEALVRGSFHRRQRPRTLAHHGRETKGHDMTLPTKSIASDGPFVVFLREPLPDGCVWLEHDGMSEAQRTLGHPEFVHYFDLLMHLAAEPNHEIFVDDHWLCQKHTAYTERDFIELKRVWKKYSSPDGCVKLPGWMLSGHPA